MSHSILARTVAAAGLAICGSSLLCSSTLAQTAIHVTNGSDSGDGSLRAALETAADAAQPLPILIVTGDDIEIASTLTYAGQHPLVIHGNGQTVKTEANVTLLTVSEGADLTVSKLDFAGPGGFSIRERGDLSGAGGKGIFVDVRDDQTGSVNLTLNSVSVSGVAYHGIHVSDCDLADACGGGSGGGGDGAPASIDVQLNNVEISDVGNGSFDADGIRIDERGDGDITFTSRVSVFSDVGADGVELDEGDAGDVIATIVDNGFIDNGEYCDPDVLASFLPATAEGEFEDGEKPQGEIPGGIADTPDDRCFERDVALYDSGFVREFEFGIDLDDGIDIDEAGPGGLRVTMLDSEILRNHDEGVDLDEEDAGDAFITILRSAAEGNTDDGFRTSESGPGNLTASVHTVTARDNGGNGVRLDEADEGTISVEAIGVTTADNDDGDDTGLRVTKQGSGEGTLVVRESDLQDGIDARNVIVTRE